MMCPSPAHDTPPCEDELNTTVSPPGVVLPMICHCCVGAAFQRTMPPNPLSPSCSVASVTADDETGRPDAVTNDTATVESAVVFGNSGPSELKVVSVEGVVAIVEVRFATRPFTVDGPTLPEKKISRTSMS